MLKLYQTKQGTVAERDDTCYRLDSFSWDAFFTEAAPARLVETQLADAARVERPAGSELLPPMGNQEIWAAGVTYARSKTARMEESKAAGGGSFYDRVYEAERPELFFKATRHRVVGAGGAVRVRSDSTWSVPEPELALAVSAHGAVIGYTIGIDMSARDIEGDNPLYLPQAKVYDQCCALGPGLLVREEALPPTTEIRLTIHRSGERVFDGSTTLSQMRRTPAELLVFLHRDNSFPQGCFLLTGTGIIPPDSFALQPGDRITTVIAPIGEMENEVIHEA